MDATFTAIDFGFIGKIVQKGVEYGRLVKIGAIGFEGSAFVAGATKFITCILEQAKIFELFEKPIAAAAKILKFYTSFHAVIPPKLKLGQIFFFANCTRCRGALFFGVHIYLALIFFNISL